MRDALEVLGPEAPLKLAVYSRTVAAPGRGVVQRRMPDDAAAAAHQLFAVLREFDAAGVQLIWVEQPPETPNGTACATACTAPRPPERRGPGDAGFWSDDETDGKVDKPRLAGLAAGLMLALLSSCGGGTEQVEPFEPRRYLAFGDEMSVLTKAAPQGRKYTVNAVAGDGTSIDCASNSDSQPSRLWTQILGATFDFVFEECNPSVLPRVRLQLRGAEGPRRPISWRNWPRRGWSTARSAATT